MIEGVLPSKERRVEVMTKAPWRSPLLAIGILFVSSLPQVAAADVTSIAASALLPKDNSVQYSTNGVGMYVPPASVGNFLAPIQLPNGSRIHNVVLEALDNSGGEFGGYVKVELVKMRYNAAWILTTCDTGIEPAPGDTRIPGGSINELVDNSEFSYGLGIVMNNPSPGWNLGFYKMIIEYDPAPTAAAETFQTSTLGRVDAFPNPSTGRFSIAYRLSRGAEVSGRVYDMKGREVAVLHRGKQGAGPYTLHWDGRDDRGINVASGSYALVVEAGGETVSRKVVLLK
jgi:hypothetical protein